MKPFDLLMSPLQGAHLIEAGAGTGKTYAIAGLCLRLVLEQAVPIREILVVTFTMAATAELKDRIRTKLKDALDAFLRGDSDDALLKSLVRARPEAPMRTEACERLRAALRDFDEAAIFTIHGFCRRMLHEHAFESGALFDTELVTDQRRLKKEIVEDFWRMHLYEAAPELTAHALDRGVTPDSLFSLTQNIAMHFPARILPEEGGDPAGAVRMLLDAFRAAVAELEPLWPSSRNEVLQKLQDPALKASIYGPKTANRLVNAMDEWLTSQEPQLFRDFDKLTPERIMQSVRKNATPPEHPLFPVCRSILEKADGLRRGLDAYLLSLRAGLIRMLGTELPERKRKRNILHYDDLLVRLRDALEKEDGDALAQAIRRRFKAALIDEFQDTDPIQYAIFHTLFGVGSHTLFLIGDPKQAIYSFRGADIFAYMQAAGDLRTVHTLDRNWRSEPGLIGAVNTLFSQTGNPFVYGEISFRPATAAPEAGHDLLTIDGMRPSPLELWFIPADICAPSVRPLPQENARRLIAGAVAAEISCLIRLGREYRAMIGRNALEEGDMAVLVRTNREAGLMQQALLDHRISSVLASEENVFDSPEARDLFQVLQGVARPARENFVRGALATDMLGADAIALDQWRLDDAGWSARLDKFKQDHELWKTRGFIRMFRTLTAREGIRSRLLSFPDGERRLTNLLHLAEILHQESVSRNLDIDRLLQWLAEQLDDGGREARDEHLLRLESDSRAVKILTIHKSKGLEYPVVFCPFAWGSSRIAGGSFYFHDESRNRALTLDLGSAGEKEHRAAAERERLAENCRLLYVALTRAKHRCYFLWGRINGTGSSAPSYLFHGAGAELREAGGENILDVLERRMAAMSDRDMHADLTRIAAESGGTIRLRNFPVSPGLAVPPHAEASEATRRRTFRGRIDASWKVASYSLLVSGSSAQTELPDRDAVPSAPTTPAFGAGVRFSASPSPDTGPVRSTERNIFSFPGGTRAGILIHDLLEQFDFAETLTDSIRRQVAEKLKAYGFEGYWDAILAGMLQNVAACALPLPEASQSGSTTALTLSRISGQARLTELEFYYPLRMLSRPMPGLADGEALEGTGIERLSFSPMRGFMHGYIDLVFEYEGRYYLADWKSNLLGPDISDYAHASLQRVMDTHFYILQSRLYALALHRYLALRLTDYQYDRHFGGVYYLFIRGMDPARGPGYGIYAERPDRMLMERLNRLLIPQAQGNPHRSE